MVSLAKGTATTQPAFDFIYKNEDGNFCLCCCRRSLRLLCCHSGRHQSIVCVACPASIVRVTRGASVTWLFFCFLSHVLLLFLTFLSREIWGMNMLNLPEVYCLEDLLIVVCIRHAFVVAIDAPLTKIVVPGWVSLWYSQRPHNSFVTFIGKAALWLQGSLPRLSLSR